MIEYSLEEYIRFKIKTHTTKSGVSLLYYENLSAGGEIHNDFILDIIQQTGQQHYNRAHEWCCGHGAIGFELLGRKICNHLTLSDIFLPAIVSCEFTAALNDFQNCTEAILINEFDNFSADKKWDLIVADPPHFAKVPDGYNPNQDGVRIILDADWKSHRIFFQTVKNYLNDNADVYLFEGYYGSTPETFADMISESGLELVGVYDDTTHTMPHTMDIGNQYILHLKPQKS